MPRDDAPLADEPQPGAIPDDQPTGLPPDQDPDAPLGVQEDPGDADPPPGPDAMPGIPTDADEPQTDG
jgi:hypothetical protein